MVLQMEVRLSGLLLIFNSKLAQSEGLTFRYFDLTLTKSEKSPLLHTLFSCLTKELQHNVILLVESSKNLEEKKGKNEGEIHAILRKYSFPVSRTESEGTILQCASNFMKENNLSLLSQLLEKVSAKVDSAGKVNHADI